MGDKFFIIAEKRDDMPISEKVRSILARYSGDTVRSVMSGFSSGGDIHIKESHRGRLTELKERTGKTEEELYNDGNPAHKKMVVFARNARQWHHADGGSMESGGSDFVGPLPQKGFTPYQDNYDKIVRDRYSMANLALRRSGEDDDIKADRLARFLGAQSALETGWTDKISDNNYSGYKLNGKKLKFDDTDAFWDYHLKNLDEKWPGWRDAQTVEEFFNIINHPELGLDTKAKYDAYNRAHRGNEVYIYAPDWDNDNYFGKLTSVYKNKINKYIPKPFDAGGMIGKYGADRIRAAMNQMKCGGRMHKYDGETEPTGQMNAGLWYNPDFGTNELLPEAVVTAPQTVEFNGRRVIVGDGSPSRSGRTLLSPPDVVNVPVQREGSLRPAPKEEDMSTVADVFENDLVGGRLKGKSDSSVINRAVSDLRKMSSDDLSEFQRELYRSGYYKDVKIPKMPAKTRSEVMELQRMLKAAGYDLGSTGKDKDGVDGAAGPKTRAAWAAYAKEHNADAIELSVADGRFGAATRKAAEAYYRDRVKAVDSVAEAQEEKRYGRTEDPSTLANIGYSLVSHIPGVNYFVPQSYNGSEEEARNLGYRTYIDPGTKQRRAVDYSVAMDGVDNPTARQIAAEQMRQYGITGDYVKDKSGYQMDNYAYLPAYGYNALARIYNAKENLPVADPLTGRAVRLGADRVETRAEELKDWFNENLADRLGLDKLVYTYADASPMREDYRNLYFGYPIRNNTLSVNERVDRMNSGDFRRGYAFVPRDTRSILALANSMGVDDGVAYTDGHQLGKFGYGRNADDERWYYDDWDLIGDNIIPGFSLVGGTPFQVYDRDVRR